MRRLLLLLLTTCSFDPVHDQAVDDLGPEAPGVRHGPLHRPNQPCLVCHGGSGPARATFSVAGTIYKLPNDLTPLDCARVELTDARGSKFFATTNTAGNFYVPQDAWSPLNPIHVRVSKGDATIEMSTNIGRNGSCASCHVDPTTRISAGHIYLAPNASLLPADGCSP
jgi:hypothetical protein